ncbi:hypothetical protein BMS3Abin03_01827 [bacterium BMS3Abin03]|nr:hypothetical protein BMS3Abin03_01827 [bacterium BMS3Abin03]
MNYIKFNLLFTLFLLFLSLGCSQTRFIPSERILDWQTAGYHRNPVDNLPKPENYLYVQPPANDPAINYRNITQKINEASKLNGRTAIILDEGTYKLSGPIKLGIKNNYIIIKGQGIGKTIIYSDVGNKKKRNDIFLLTGRKIKLTGKYEIIDYDKESRTIFLNKKLKELKADDYIDIRVPNGSWDNSINHDRWGPKDYFGQVVEIVSFDTSETRLQLRDDISFVWKTAKKESIVPYIEIIDPVREIGIEDVTLISDTNNNGIGVNIAFTLAVDSWLKNIESVNPPMDHVNISTSSSIEIRGSYFHEAQDYGYVPGAGYGVSIFNRSTNCLVENNIFKHLRHSMMVSLSVSKNVFGYNYSLDQYSFPAQYLGDLNVHGHYAFGNLFEGNYVDRITADDYWGKNGPYNTFFRNYCKYNSLVLQQADFSNVIGNKCKLIIENSNGLLIDSSSVDNFIPDISYYRKRKPEFYDDSLSWPSIGPPTEKDSKVLEQNIPARKRYCSWKGSDCN